MIQLPKGSGLAFSIVVVALLVAAAISGFAWWERQQGAAEALHQARVDQALETAKPHHARNDSLVAVRDTLRSRARARLAQAATPTPFLDSIRAAIDKLPVDTVVPIRVVRRIIEVADARAAHLQGAVSFLDEALTLETERADSAERRVYQLEEIIRTNPSRCRIVVVPCPSRTMSFVAGAAAATLLFVMVDR